MSREHRTGSTSRGTYMMAVRIPGFLWSLFLGLSVCPPGMNETGDDVGKVAPLKQLAREDILEA